MLHKERWQIAIEAQKFSIESETQLASLINNLPMKQAKSWTEGFLSKRSCCTLQIGSLRRKNSLKGILLPSRHLISSARYLWVIGSSCPRPMMIASGCFTTEHGFKIGNWIIARYAIGKNEKKKKKNRFMSSMARLAFNLFKQWIIRAIVSQHQQLITIRSIRASLSFAVWQNISFRFAR